MPANLVVDWSSTEDTRAVPSLQPVDAEFLDSAPFRVVTEVLVSAPIEACWSLLVDQASWPQWFDDMSTVEANPWLWTEPGQTRQVTVNKLKVDEVAISLEPQREYAFSITKWPLPIAKRAAEGVRLVDRTDGESPRTQLTYIGAFELTWFSKWLEPILQRRFNAAWGPALQNLGALAGG